MARHDTRDTGATVLHFARTLNLTLTLALSLYQVLDREQRSGTGEGTEGYRVSALEQFVMPLRPVKFAFNFTYTRRNCATRV